MDSAREDDECAPSDAETGLQVDGAVTVRSASSEHVTLSSLSSLDVQQKKNLKVGPVRVIAVSQLMDWRSKKFYG